MAALLSNNHLAVFRSLEADLWEESLEQQLGSEAVPHGTDLDVDAHEMLQPVCILDIGDQLAGYAPT